MVIDVTVKIKNQERILRALVDSGAEADCINRRIAVEMSIPALAGPPTSLQSPNGSRIYAYANHSITVSAEDSTGDRRDTEVTITSCDFEMDDIDIILGYPWLTEVDPCISFKSTTWRHPIVDHGLEILSAKQFARVLKTEAFVYGLTITPWAPSKRLASLQQATPTEVPEPYKQYEQVFSVEEAGMLPQHQAMDHAIELEPDSTPPFGPVYALSEKELEVLREYLDKSMAKGWIRRSTSPAGAPIMFVPKKGGGLRLCVDYRGLNRITKKNRTPLPLISETFDRLRRARRFTKFDLKDAYHRLRIRDGDEWKTAFRTRYGHFEYCVMPFGLSNAPATFQAYINHALIGLVDVTCVVYLDDILVFSEDPSKHEEAVRQVLARLEQYKLYVNLEKCRFDVDTVEFLGFVISPDGVSMEESRVSAITEWQTPQTFKDVQVFLGFANFYRRFIYGYSRVAKAITDLLKGGGKMPFYWSPQADTAFNTLKSAFTSAPILRHYDPALRIRVETDASGFAVAGILSQLDETAADPKWHPIAFYSRKLTDTESRYETHDSELLAIVEAFRTWRHYLAYASREVVVLTDHNNLKYFMTKRKLNSRQARWAEELAAFDFVIAYRPGNVNPADGPSRRPDYAGGHPAGVPLVFYSRLKSAKCSCCPIIATVARRCADPATPQYKAQERGIRHPPISEMLRSKPQVVGHLSDIALRVLKPVADAAGCKQYVSRVMAMLVAEPETAYEESSESLLELLAKLQGDDPFVQTRQYDKYSKPTRAGDVKTWELDATGLLRYRGAVYVPSDPAVKAELLRANHDDPLAGHFGVSKTLEVLRRKYFWKNMKQDVHKYVKTCPICQRTKVKRHRPYGALASFPTPSKPWEEITLDFITGLPPSKFRGKVYDSVLVIVDRYTKLARYIPTTKTITAAELAELFILYVVKDFGIPKGMTSDRGSVFTSKFWSTLCFYLKIRRRLSTAFHPQTDGQTENLNQTLEHYLRCHANYQQDDWASKLALAEFTYNNSIHSTTGISPFYAMYGFHPSVEFHVGDNGPKGEAPAATARVQRILDERKQLEERWANAVRDQKKHYDKKHKPMVFKKDDKVMLLAKNIRQLRPSVKLSDKYLGPFDVVEVIGDHGQAYRLKLPPTYKIHDVFHVSLLEPWHHREGDIAKPEAIEIDGVEHYIVESIQAHKETKQGRQYLVRWKGYAPGEDTWEPPENLQNVPEEIDKYLQRGHSAITTRRRRQKKARRQTNTKPAKRGRPRKKHP